MAQFAELASGCVLINMFYKKQHDKETAVIISMDTANNSLMWLPDVVTGDIINFASD